MRTNIHTSGFSLLEILVALAIFSVVSVATYHQINAISTTAIRIEEKYYALWVGKNIVEQYFIKREWPSTGEDVVEYEMAGRNWHVKTLISSNDDNADIRMLEISVYKDQADKNAVITLYRMIGKN